MRPDGLLPNLLDDRLRRESVSRFLAMLSDLRRKAFSEWTARYRSSKLHPAVERAMDEAIALALAAEYMRAAGHDCTKVLVSATRNATRLNPAELAEAVAGKVGCRHLDQALMQGACTSRLPIPSAVAEQVFVNGIHEAMAQLGSLLPITALGDFHQLCLANPLCRHDQNANLRRENGAHYTPSPLVDYLVARVLPRSLSELPDSRPLHILDPSCGCGAFLIAAARYMSSLPPRKGHHRNGGSTFGIYGSDVDHRAVALTRLGLALARATSTRRGSERAELRQSPCLLVEDFLDDAAWRRAEFDVIIGGPPFVRVEQLHRSDARKVHEYRQRFESARTGQFDLYMPFIEKSVELLKPGGRLAFSVSSSFLRSKSGRRLRDVIGRHCHVEEIVEFEDGNLYPDAAVQIAAVFLRRSPAKGHTRYIFLPARPDLRGQMSSLLSNRCRSVSGSRVSWINLAPNNDCTWRFHSDRKGRQADRAEAVGTPLGKVPVDISLGVCTGADSIFILKRQAARVHGTAKLISRNGEDHELEEGVLRQILRARCSRTTVGMDSQYVCIFPYDDRGSPLEEDYFRKAFPRAYAYLQEHRDRLLRRRLCSGQPWYALRKVDVSRLLARPKIFAPAFLSKRGFMLDNSGILCHHGIVSISRIARGIDVYYLLGLLNSSLMWRYICLAAAPAAGTRRILRLDLVRKLPIAIPKTKEQCGLALRISALVRKYISCRSTEPVHAMIDRLSERLYGL